jgi:uncharacterized protein YodC (DUF2158 family)
MVEFKVGDTVRLNSGGPLMTVDIAVQRTDGGQNVYCIWFEGSLQKKGHFNSLLLKADDGAPFVA